MLSVLRPALGSLLLLLCLGTTLPAEGTPALPAPGNLLEQEVPGSSVKLRFRYCPGGVALVGRPDKEPKQVKLHGFYLGEAEVSVAEFVALLGPEALNALLQHVEKLGLKAEGGLYSRLLRYQKGEENLQQPLGVVDIDNALRFCKEVDRRFHLERSKRKGVDALEVLRVRLPSYAEWVYACRARSEVSKTSDVLHFPRAFERPLPSFKDLDEDLQKQLQELITTTKLPAANPTDLPKLLLDLDAMGLPRPERDKLNAVLEAYFHRAYNWRTKEQRRGESSIVLDQYAARDEAAKKPEERLSWPNEWQLWGMLDNDTEWVLWQDGSSPLDQIWKNLLDKGSASARERPLLFLAGGSWTSGYDKPNSLTTYTIWGGPRLSSTGEPAPLSYDTERDLLQIQPSFRLVLERRLASDWFLLVRDDLSRATAAEGQKLVQAIKDRIDRLTTKEEAQTQSAILDLYSPQKKKEALQTLLKKGYLNETDRQFEELLD